MASIGVNAWVWISPFTNNDFGLLKKVKKMGFDSFEIGLEDPSHVNGKEFGKALKDHDLRLVVCGAFGPSRDLTSDNAANRKEGLEYIKTTIQFCADAGAEVMAGPMYSAVGKRRHVSPEQKKIEWDLAVKGLTEAANTASDCGVRLAIEPLNRFETDLVNTSAQGMKMVNDIGHKSLGIHLDSFHMHIEEKCQYDAIMLAGKKLWHFHSCENDRGAPGSGLVDWKSVSKALKDVKYKGECVIESFTPECKAIAAAAAIWRPLAKTQDGLAKDGLKFLRKKLKHK